ncbi:tape measure protein [Lysinibacillus telephonicus]|uniref:tape measure protein n=1 Tax=Lysinibacillus telephonicus TaxID=1714840 RepID=UPI0037CF6E11
MATIRTAIQINDMMSKQFRAMNMAMMTVIDSFQTLEDVTGNAVDISALNAAQRELQQVEANFNQIEREIKQAEHAQEKLNQDINRADKLASNLLGTIGAIAGTYFTIQVLGNAISISDEMTNTTARLDMMNDKLQTTAELQQIIYESAQRSYSSYSKTADMVAKLSMNAAEAFDSNKEAVIFAELLNKQFSIAGTSQEEMNSALLQLTQALGSGVLRGEELNAVFEAAPNIIRTISNYLDVSISEIRELASEGKITAEIVKSAMFSAADDINEKFNKMPVTWSQIWTSFQNEALWAFQEVLVELNKIANSETFKSFVDDVKKSLYILAQVTLSVIQVLASIGGFIYDNWSIIGPIILGVGGALLVLVAALTLARTWALLATVGMWALNTALAANPIVLVIAALVLLIGLFYAAIAVINHFAGTSISATGIIVAGFAFMYSTFYNVIVFMLNLVLMFVEFWVNVWKNPIYTVKRLFGNLAINALDMAKSMIGSFDSAATNLANMFIEGANWAIKGLNWLIEKLNEIPGIELGKFGEISARASLVGDYSQMTDKINEWVGEAPEDYWEAPKLDYTSPFDNAMNAYDWGANLFNFDQPKQDDSWQKDQEALMKSILDSLGSGNDLAGDTADNTGKLKDSVDMATEDLKYLRDLAERDTINRYTTAQIKVDMRNENHINSELDIDGVIDRFGERAEEVAEMLAEGGDSIV